MDTRVTQASALSNDDLAAIHAVWIAAGRKDDPASPQPTLEDTIYNFRNRSDYPEQLVVTTRGYVDSDIVGWGLVSLPPSENRHLAEIDVTVHPEHRNQGVGSAILRDAAQAASSAGRRTIVLNVVEGSVAHEWARRLKLTEAHRSVLSGIRLNDVPSEVLTSELGVADSSLRQGYRLEYWLNEIPNEWRTSYGELKTQLHDAPQGAIEENAHAWSANDVTHWLREIGTGRELRIVAVISDDASEVVGLTEVAISPWTPARAWQNDTAVKRKHRGKRLGRWLKAAQLDWIRRARPDVAEIETWNAVDNTYMRTVNEHFGFTVWKTYVHMQGSVADLAEALRW